MIKIYHNPKCSKSRGCLNYLHEKDETPEVVEYLKADITKEELKDVVSKLDCSVEDIIRKGEDDYKNNFKGKTLSEDEWIDAIIKYPKILERPIVVKGNKAVVARPLENINKIL